MVLPLDYQAFNSLQPQASGKKAVKLMTIAEAGRATNLDYVVEMALRSVALKKQNLTTGS